jgi:DNA-binding transcriptional ArsR family regulator
MDLTDPTRAVISTLDGPVLAVLASTGHPMTVGEVASRMPRGSEIGVRRSLARLVEQGTVKAVEMGRNRVHELNREHVAAQVAELLAGLRLELWKRLRDKFAGWSPLPIYACVFGSAARGDGGPDSDVDVLLVHSPFPGEIDPRRQSANLFDQMAGFAGGLMVPALSEPEASQWRRQVDELRGQIHAWTGNSAQIVDISAFEWAQLRQLRTELFEAIERDSVEVYKAAISPATLISGLENR